MASFIFLYLFEKWEVFMPHPVQLYFLHNIGDVEASVTDIQNSFQKNRTADLLHPSNRISLMP